MNNNPKNNNVKNNKVDNNTSDSDSDFDQHNYKVVILGDGSVGKTSITQNLNSFKSEYKQTIGIDFYLKTIELPGDLIINLKIWDIGGQSIASNMLSQYIYQANAIILVYDITNYDSFYNLNDWYDIYKKKRKKIQ